MDKECCYTCQNSEIFETPQPYTDGIDSGELYGHCHKGGGKYNIFIPGGKCKDYKSKEETKVNEELRQAMEAAKASFDDLKNGLKQVIETAKEQQSVDTADWKNYNLGSHKDIKKIIQDNINSVCANYVAIGFYLNVVNDRKLYEEDGYSGIGEYAAAEYGIPKDRCSRLMKIAERFCIENSPALLPEYRDFAISKLQEMVGLDDKQLEQITLATTRAEIREMKKPEPEKVVHAQLEPKPVKEYHPCKFGGGKCNLFTDGNCSGKARCTSNFIADIEPEQKVSYLKCAAYDFNKFGKGCKDCFYDKADCPYDRTDYFIELKRKEEFSIRCEVLKEMCNSICKNRSHVLEKNSYGSEAIKNVSRDTMDHSFGFGDDGAGHSKYDSEYKAKTNQYHVKEFFGSGKWTFEAGEVEQQIWNYNGNTWRFQQREAKKLEPVTDIQEPENDQPESGTETVNIVTKYIELDAKAEKIDSEEPSTTDETVEMCLHNPDKPCTKCNPYCQIKIPERNTDLPCDTCGYDKDGCCDYPDTPDDFCVEGDKWKPKEEQVETLTADIIQTVPEDDDSEEDEEDEPIDPEQYTYRDVDEELDRLMRFVESFRKDNAIAPARRKNKMRFDAICLLSDKMRQDARPNADQENVQRLTPKMMKRNGDCYTCPTCGAVMIAEYYTKQIYWKFCAYCGQALVMTDAKTSNPDRPDRKK